MIGGAEGDRTPDLMTASHALSQLSYGPMRVKRLVVRLMQTSVAFCVESSNGVIAYSGAHLAEISTQIRLKHPKPTLVTFLTSAPPTFSWFTAAVHRFDEPLLLT